MPAPKPTVRVDDRLVLTYRAGGKDAGLLVAFVWGGGFFCEHVVAFPGAPLTALPRMLDAGLAEAARRGAKYIGVYIERSTRGSALQKLALALGFQGYQRGPGGTYLVKYQEAA